MEQDLVHAEREDLQKRRVVGWLVALDGGVKAAASAAPARLHVCDAQRPLESAVKVGNIALGVGSRLGQFFSPIVERDARLAGMDRF